MLTVETNSATLGAMLVSLAGGLVGKDAPVGTAAQFQSELIGPRDRELFYRHTATLDRASLRGNLPFLHLELALADRQVSLTYAWSALPGIVSPHAE